MLVVALGSHCIRIEHGVETQIGYAVDFESGASLGRLSLLKSSAHVGRAAKVMYRAQEVSVGLLGCRSGVFAIRCSNNFGTKREVPNQ